MYWQSKHCKFLCKEEHNPPSIWFAVSLKNANSDSTFLTVGLYKFKGVPVVFRYPAIIFISLMYHSMHFISLFRTLQADKEAMLCIVTDAKLLS